MTPQKKRLYLVILLCAVVAMVIDRLAVGYAPETAKAVTSPAAGVGLRNSDVAKIDSIPELPFPRFVEVTGPIEFVDFFMPPSLRQISSKTETTNTTSDMNNRQKNLAKKTNYLTFESTYSLDAVMLSPKFHVAIINGSWVQLGQELDGCKLAELTDNIARFDCNDGSATLRVINISSVLQD